MSPRSHYQLEKIRRDTRERILVASMRLFAEKTFDRTTTDEIAKAAGISKGLIYNYFESKEAILDVLIQRVDEELLALLEKIGTASPPRQQFEELVTLWLQSFREQSLLWKLIYQLHLQPGVLLRSQRKLQSHVGGIAERIRSLFVQLGSPDPVADFYLFGSQMDGIGLNYTASPQGFPFDLVRRRILEQYRYSQPTGSAGSHGR